MPTFTAIALERFLEPGDSRSASDGAESRRRKPPVPLPRSAVRRKAAEKETEKEKEKEKPQWPKISPALYATPAATPLPDSPTLLSPSPYLINHKRRGPRLQKSFSEASVSTEKALDESVVDTNSASCSVGDDVVVVVVVGGGGEEEREMGNGVVKDVAGMNLAENEKEKESESEDFYDPQETMSVASNTDGEDVGADISAKTPTPGGGGVFYDAWDDLSSESGRQVLSSMHDLETELREIKLSMLMEVEKRNQAEDALNSMQSQWQSLREKLREVGLVLPADLPTIVQDAPGKVDFTEEICQQISVSRYVAESIGRGAARAECEEEMQAQLESKNFEIARLSDRLHYYETMNREMSQRNQETIELARRGRQRRRNSMQKWIWGSIATAVTLGSVAIAWSYIPSGNTSSSHQLPASESDTPLSSGELSPSH